MQTDATHGKPTRIAIIDDDPAVRHSLGMLLDTRGWTSEAFERAADFLGHATPDSYHCLVIDVRILVEVYCCTLPSERQIFPLA